MEEGLLATVLVARSQRAACIGVTTKCAPRFSKLYVQERDTVSVQCDTVRAYIYMGAIGMISLQVEQPHDLPVLLMAWQSPTW